MPVIVLLSRLLLPLPDRGTHVGRAGSVWGTTAFTVQGSVLGACIVGAQSTFAGTPEWDQVGFTGVEFGFSKSLLETELRAVEPGPTPISTCLQSPARPLPTPQLA